MVTVRSAKNKGSQFEYSCRDSLLQWSDDVLLTKQEGFVSQYDLISKNKYSVFECKRHRAFSWNELESLFNKLEKNAPDGYNSYLLFQANRQPCLVMRRLSDVNRVIVERFETCFSYQFIKHIGKKK